MLNAVVVLLFYLNCTPVATSHAAVHMLQILVNMFFNVFAIRYWQIWCGTGTDYGLQQIVLGSRETEAINRVVLSRHGVNLGLLFTCTVVLMNKSMLCPFEQHTPHC